MFNKITPLLLMLSLIVSCGKSGGGSGGGVSAAEQSAEATLEDPTVQVENDALTFETDIKMYKYTSSGEKKILAAAELIKRVITSAKFKSKVLNHTYNGKKTFVDNGGMSNAQIYQKIIDASEKLTPGKDGVMDLEVELYTDNSSNTVGYTYPSTIRVWMNSKYFNKNTAALVTTNMVHEWLHKLGFKHAQKATANRKYSVPYAIGYMVRDMAKAL